MTVFIVCYFHYIFELEKFDFGLDCFLDEWLPWIMATLEFVISCIVLLEALFMFLIVNKIYCLLHSWLFLSMLFYIILSG